MHKVIVAGAGKIGALIACLLVDSGEYEVHMADMHFEGDDIKQLLKTMPDIKTVALDVSNHDSLESYIHKNDIHAVISSLPYFCNQDVALVARKTNIHYFDLTEDVEVTRAVKEIAEGAEKAFVPQCGLAPGFISISANSLMKRFDSLDEAKLRVGALPQNTSNALHYALTWSTEGVINEYANICHGIKEKEETILHPLEDLECIKLDGLNYEAFNTSGGLGSLSSLYYGKINTLNYKTMRYPGHCEKMRVLLNDLKLKDDRSTLKHILERAIPKTYQDLVIVYVSVTGHKDGVYVEENYLKKVYPTRLSGINWSAIQVTTASGICTVVDMVLTDQGSYHGLVLQENFSMDVFLKNRFGHFYA
jgi:saccharopine dehydrogenase-like NADP-dependent oxidoreductase